MTKQTTTVSRGHVESVLATNSVIRNTYILLSLSLLVSAATATFAVITNAPPLSWIFLIGYFGLLFLVRALQNSAWGVGAVFLFTGFMGYTLGPILNFAINGFSNGPEIVAASLGLTGAIFLGLSGYAMSTRKDFSYLAGFLISGILVIFAASILNIFMQIPGIQLAISSAMVLIASGFILFETAQIINGGERNYISATISLYISIFNLFINLLHLLMALAGRRD